MFLHEINCDYGILKSLMLRLFLFLKFFQIYYRLQDPSLDDLDLPKIDTIQFMSFYAYFVNSITLISR